MKSAKLTGAIGTVLGLAIAATPIVAHSAEKLTGRDCTQLFKQLNTSNNGHLTSTEAAAHPIGQKAFSDPAAQRKGFLTETEFNSACVGTDQASPSQSRSPEN